jgi:hypothetical protein
MAQKWYNGLALLGLVQLPAFTVSPADSATFSGKVGGPFAPSSKTYTLSNNTASSLTWTASNTQSWLTKSSTGGTLAAYSSTDVTISPAAAANSLPLGNYSDTVTFTDTTHSITATRDVALYCGGGTGTILREYWLNITGNAVSALTSDARFPNSPDGSSQLTSLEGPSNWADSYGTMISGYVHPTVSGSYTFWVAGDDNVNLYLSADAQPANKVLIAQVPDWTDSREWTKFSQQQSPTISLVAGQKYYIEVLHKESAGGDNVAVAWQGPGLSQQVIQGAFLSPWVGPHGGGGSTATTASVSAITVTAVSAGGSNKRGQAQVTIVNNLGNPVANATVTGNFTGTFNEASKSAVTNASGVATLQTSGTAKGTVSVTFTVTGVTATGLTYNPAANVETSDHN